MERWMFKLVLALTAGVIYLLTGRNRRQIEKIPKGMAILCQPQGKRYIMYALGIVVFVFVMFFTVLFIMDGAPKEARFMWSLCVIMAVLILFITILSGNLMARECVYFNHEKIQIHKAFQKPRTLQWNEIRKIDGSFDTMMHLYLLDGTKILTIRIGMVNYELFCAVLKKKCPEITTKYYHSRIYEQPNQCILRYGSQYYVLAVMGIFMMLFYLAILFSADDSNLFEKIWQRHPSEWFSLWFGPVCGVISIIFLFILSNTNIRYSPEKMILKYPLQRKRELYWRNIQKIEMILAEKQENWKKLRLYTPEKVYVLNLTLLTYGKDGFMTELFKMVEKYDISYTEVYK